MEGNIDVRGRPASDSLTLIEIAKLGVILAHLCSWEQSLRATTTVGELATVMTRVERESDAFPEIDFDPIQA